MNFGFIKVGACTKRVKVVDVSENVEYIIEGIAESKERGVNLLVFPELSVTGYTSADLFYMDVLLSSALEGVKTIAKSTVGFNGAVVVGAPYMHDGLIYNSAFVLANGEIKGIVPKTYIPNYNEFYEKRWFAPAPDRNFDVQIEIAFQGGFG
ncbi:MAG: hypothetical protein MJ072_05695 [Clostridia bacterium]|nr:hypothetical protein [Clostridia bacterium]